MSSQMLPVRGLGSKGIISDINPYDLDPQDISRGINIRFENGKIGRSAVFKDVIDLPETPGAVLSLPPVSANGYYTLVTVAHDFSKIHSIVGEVITDITPDDHVGYETDDTITTTFLGAVSYINRGSHVPLFKRPGDLKYRPLTEFGWDPMWRCKSLRTYKDFMVALNVTKGASEYPTMVKWSDITGFGGPPPSWDAADATRSAGENILNEMKVEIVDGLTLRDAFIIYGRDEVWTMDYIGGNLLFRFRKLFADRGVISQNCVVQVDGIHYVFDHNDIYQHDGVSASSIVYGANKEAVFKSLRNDRKHLCFVFHNPSLNEIYFCFSGEDGMGGHPVTEYGCNRAYVWNYKRQTGSLIDLPQAVGATMSTVVTGYTWDTLPEVSWDDLGGTWKGDDDDKELVAIFAGRQGPGLSADRLYGMDTLTNGHLVRPISEEANTAAIAERTGIDLDNLGVPLPFYKAIHEVYPQLGVYGDTSSVEFQFGATDICGAEPVWTPWMKYTPATMHKLDVRMAGRYLSWRLRYVGTSDFAFSGFDAKVAIRGRRG